jgi:hypothetical protein
LENVVVLKLVGVAESSPVASLQNGQGILAKVSMTNGVEILLEKEKTPVDRQTIRVQEGIVVAYTIQTMLKYLRKIRFTIKLCCFTE